MPVADSLKCPRCRMDNLPHAAYCWKCGKPIPSSNVEVDPRVAAKIILPKAIRRLVWLLIEAAIIIAVLIALFRSPSPDKPKQQPAQGIAMPYQQP